MDSIKASLAGGVIAGATLIGIFAIMADCSKSVSRTGTDAVAACIKSGGEWIGDNSGEIGSFNFCRMPERAR